MRQTPTALHSWGRAAEQWQSLHCTQDYLPPCSGQQGLRPRDSPSSGLPNTHLGDFDSMKIRKAFQGDCENIGRSVDGELFAGQHFLLASAQKELELFKLFYHPNDCQPWPNHKPHRNDPADTRHRSRAPAHSHVFWPRCSSWADWHGGVAGFITGFHGHIPHSLARSR